MLFDLMHTRVLRVARVVIGAAMIGGAVMQDVMLAFPMVITACLLIVTASVDVSILEELFRLCGGDVAERMHPKGSH